MGNQGVGLTDLCKSFDTLKHDLLIAKFNTYGFQQDALKLLYGYLTKQWNRTNVTMFFSSWEELIKGAPHGSVLYLADFTEVCNFADDTRFNACSNNLNI